MATPQKIEPRTVLLRQGLDAGQTYFINEEEVPRAGTKISQRFERTRCACAGKQGVEKVRAGWRSMNS